MWRRLSSKGRRCFSKVHLSSWAGLRGAVYGTMTKLLVQTWKNRFRITWIPLTLEGERIQLNSSFLLLEPLLHSPTHPVQTVSYFDPTYPFSLSFSLFLSRFPPSRTPPLPLPLPFPLMSLPHSLPAAIPHPTSPLPSHFLLLCPPPTPHLLPSFEISRMWDVGYCITYRKFSLFKATKDALAAKTCHSTPTAASSN